MKEINKYILLLWTEELPKFFKEIEDKNIKDKFQKILILGEELKIDDFKQINKYKNLPFEIDKAYVINNLYTEIFTLGRCKELCDEENNIKTSLVLFSNPAKELVELSQKLDILVLSWSQFFKQTMPLTPIAKNTSKTDKKIESIVTKPKNEKKSEIVLENNKKPTKTTVKNSNKTNNSNTKELITCVKKAKLDKSDEDFFLMDNNLASLEKVIKNASDVNIGLPFQLQMYFGEKGKLLETAFKKSFDKLKETI